MDSEEEGRCYGGTGHITTHSLFVCLVCCGVANACADGESSIILLL